MKYYLFPKEFGDVSVDRLMELCVKMGFDGPTALVRDGYQLSDSNLKTALAEYVKTAQKHGLSVTYAQTGLQMKGLSADNQTLKALADGGITQVRTGMMGKDVVPDYRMLDDYLKRAVADAENAARANKIQLVVQIHGNLYPHNATAVWNAVKDSDPRYIGIKLDPGNNLVFEGYERFDYQIRLLRDYIVAVGVKDAAILQTPGVTGGAKGWHRRFVPVTKGMTDWKLILSELRSQNFTGPLVFMPFFEAADRDELIRVITEEVQFMKEQESL
ncbi:MAG: sugar phosphate isomerase/epimerase [Oscillospiraceae bacterium]|nr:sugar phosphate isomerase/epimerase [Oscillospiraceae bacterium]